MALTDEQSYATVTTAIVLNALSIFACLLVVGYYCTVRWLKPELADRVSLRLSVYIAISDIFYCSLQIISDVTYEDNALCGFSVWGYVFGTLTSIFLLACIAVNLVILLVFPKARNYPLEALYVGISVSISLLVSLLPISDKMYGFEPNEGTCWYRNPESQKYYIWQWLSLYAWVSLSLCVSTGCVIAVLLLLRKSKLHFIRNSSSAVTTTMMNSSAIAVEGPGAEAGETGSLSGASTGLFVPPFNLSQCSSVDSATSPQGNAATAPSSKSGHGIFSGPVAFLKGPANSALASRSTAAVAKKEQKLKRSEEKKKTISSSAYRIILYPLVPLLTQSFNIIATIDQQIHDGEFNFGLLYCAYFGTSMQGILTATVFAFDPNVKKSFAYIKEYFGWSKAPSDKRPIGMKKVDPDMSAKNAKLYSEGGYMEDKNMSVIAVRGTAFELEGSGNDVSTGSGTATENDDHLDSPKMLKYM